MICRRSPTPGLRIFASTIAANHPAASMGLSDVNQETANAVAAEKGCPPASRVNAALKMPLIRIQ